MKSQKLLVNSAAACVLVGASGGAMAVDCPEGFIIGGQVDEITIDGQSCHIEGVTVDGNVTVINSPNIDLADVEVKGSVSLTAPADVTSFPNASLFRVDSFGGNIDVKGYTMAVVSHSITRGGGEAAVTGNMTVNDNAAAVVYSNIVDGNLTCSNNTELNEFFNRVYGIEDCVGEVVP